ncbi:MAG: MFS transporter [Candidatus Diapherotrites archaeon]|nr:MFS transporter [Candidatus Diapherotrites archaeon]
MLNQLKKYPAPLRISIVEGMMASIMSGGGMVFVVPFAVFLGANSFEVGLLTAIPALLAAWFQIGSIKLIQIYKNRKSIVLFTVALQAVSWIAIALIPFIFPMQQVGWLIALTTISVVVGTIGAPLWQSWMRSLTPKEILGEYFGVRNALTGAVVFLATLLGGLALNLAEPSVTLYAFVGIFIASFIGRAISAGLFSKIEEPKFLYNPREVIGIGHYIKQLGKDNFGHFVLFGTLMTFTIGMITPFISLYFLEGLGLNNNYLLYTILISASTLTAVISMPHWGRMIDKFGTIKLLQTTGLIVCEDSICASQISFTNHSNQRK